MGNKNIHAEDIMPECPNLSTQVPGERNVSMLRCFFVSFCSWMTRSWGMALHAMIMLLAPLPGLHKGWAFGAVVIPIAWMEERCYRRNGIATLC